MQRNAQFSHLQRKAALDCVEDVIAQTLDPDNGEYIDPLAVEWSSSQATILESPLKNLIPLWQGRLSMKQVDKGPLVNYILI